MNLVLDDAEEVYIAKPGKEAKARQDLGEWLDSAFDIRYCDGACGEGLAGEGACVWAWRGRDLTLHPRMRCSTPSPPRPDEREEQQLQSAAIYLSVHSSTHSLINLSISEQPTFLSPGFSTTTLTYDPRPRSSLFCLHSAEMSLTPQDVSF